MSELAPLPAPDAMLDALHLRRRSLELEAFAVRARIEEVDELIGLALRHQRRKPGPRPRVVVAPPPEPEPPDGEAA